MDDDFYLCQPDSVLASAPACASCCGIYNYPGHNRELVTQILTRQTELMAGWDGTDADMERVAAEAMAGRPAPRFEVIYNCPFAGFYDPERRRVGCLLHPRVRGRDLRDFCRYGHRTCGEAKCTAYTYLEPAEARAVMAAAGDWYLYGLAITDIDLIKDFFELCEMKLYAPLALERVAAEPALARALGEYLRLKEDWHLARDPGRFGKYYFVGRDYHIYQIDFRGFEVSRPYHEAILLSLGSVIGSREQLDQAVAVIDARVDAFLEVYSSTGEGRRR
jgi:hypothetical protein